MAGNRRGRDAGSGQFIPESQARRNPNCSVVETLPTRTRSGPSAQIGRDARTGEFIPVQEAVRRPATTTIETIHRKK